MAKKPIRRRKRPAPRQLVHDDLPELQHARALWQRNKLADALTLFLKAAKDHPNNAIALVDASRALGKFYRTREAEALLDRLVATAGRHAGSFHLAGQSFRLLRRPSKAKACFQKALAINDSLADAHLELALLLERENCLDQSEQHVESRLTLLPDDQEAHYLKARLARRKGDYDTASNLLRGVCKSTQAHWLTKARAYTELAGLLDEQGDYASAWDTMLAGKQVLKPHCRDARRHRDRIVPRLVELAEQVSADQLAEWQAETLECDQQVALLTGLPRSGTTLMEVLLDAHPDIVACDELDAFPNLLFPSMLGTSPLEELCADTLSQLTLERINKLAQAYVGYLEDAHRQSTFGRVVLDKNPSLLLLIPAYQRLIPNARFVVAVRDPRDTFLSCMMTFFPPNDFSVDFLTPDSGMDRIALDLDVWEKVRQKLTGNWTEVRYEEVVAAPRDAIQPTLRMLGVKTENQEDSEPSTSDLFVSAPSYLNAKKPVYASSVGRWRNYEDQISAYLPRFKAVLSSFGYTT